MSLKLKTGLAPLLLMGIGILALIVMAGCDSAPKTSSSGDTTSDYSFSTPTVAESEIDQGTTTIVDITVTDDNGDPYEGLEVIFGVEPSTGGTFSPAVDTSDSNGLVSSIFTASQAGNLILYCRSGNTASPYASLTVNGTSQQTSGNMSIDISPSLLTADGTSSATVIISVADELDNPAPEGTLVKITAGERFVDVDGNGYFTPNVDSLAIDYNANSTWDAIGFIPATAYTDASGAATVTYTAGTEATTAYVKATVSGTTDYDGHVETSMQLTPDASVFAIELATSDPGIQVRHTGGPENTTMMAICYDVNGNTVPEGLAVSFTIQNSPGGGENINGQGTGPVEAITNANGIASVQLWSGTISGTVRMYASAGSVLSNATFVAIYAGPPYYIDVGAEKCNIPGWDVVNYVNTITATVGDFYHNPVQDSTAVYFTTDEGIVGSYGLTFDSTGVAQQVYRTADPRDDGRIWVWAETAGGTVVDSVMFINSHIPATVSAVMSPTHLIANGTAEAVILSDVRDLNNNFVSDGTVVKNKAAYGSVGSGTTDDGCYTSLFEDTYTSPVLDQDYSTPGGDDDQIGAIDVITSRSGFIGTAVVCTLTTVEAYHSKSSVALDNSSIPYSSTGMPVRVIIKDRYGNPLGDHSLTASITVGTMTVNTGETNTFGEAYGFRFNAPAPPPPDVEGNIPTTPAIITVIDNDPMGLGLILSATVTFKAED